MTVEQARMFLAIRGPEFFFDRSTSTWDFGFKAVKIEYYWISLSFLIADGDFLFAFMYFVFSL